MDLQIINLENKNVGKHSVDIDSNKEINKFAISQVVKWQLAKKRSGTKINSSPGISIAIFSAFAEVQQTSHSAFASA